MKPFKALLFAVLLVPFFTKAQTTQQLPKQNLSYDTVLVRGVCFDSFRAVSALSDTSLNAIAAVAWQLWQMEQWATLETLFTVNNLNGGWPPNNGATYSKMVTLDSGMLVDRYGGWFTNGVFNDQGQFIAPAGEPFKDRSLQQATKSKPYRIYKIVKAIPDVNQGQAIPWFQQAGLGLQYKLPYPINDLVKNGYLQYVSDVPKPQ
jgi:hypothetical protein